MAVGTSLASLRAAHQRRLQSKAEVQPGGKELLGLPALTQEDLWAIVVISGSGVQVPVFVLGLHDPDDPLYVRWVP